MPNTLVFVTGACGCLGINGHVVSTVWIGTGGAACARRLRMLWLRHGEIAVRTVAVSATGGGSSNNNNIVG